MDIKLPITSSNYDDMVNILNMVECYFQTTDYKFRTYIIKYKFEYSKNEDDRMVFKYNYESSRYLTSPVTFTISKMRLDEDLLNIFSDDGGHYFFKYEFRKDFIREEKLKILENE